MSSDTDNPRYDPEARVIRVRHVAGASVGTILATHKATSRVMAETGCRYVLTVVEGAVSYMSKADRDRLAEHARNANYEREALVTANPMVRMLAKAINLVAKRNYPIRYFRREDEALAWLEEERES